jgi:hypothetical protein
MPVRRTLLALSIAAASLLVVASATGANKPGDPCAKEGELADLGSGKIQCVGGTWKPYAGSGPGQPSAPATSTVKAAAIFTPIGAALSTDTFPGATQVADVTGVRLADGRVRLYAWVSPGGIRSAVSTDASGTSFVAEPGLRITWAPGGQTRAYVLDDGRVRLFYLDGGNIKSAVSSDGLTFVDEGVRISSAAAGFEPGGLSVVKVGAGYRGYFSVLERPGVREERIARTATSPDMLTWTVGPYVAGSSGSIKDGASHPFAVSDGTTIALYYNGDRGSFYGALRSTSTDGVTFASERTILSGAGDPQLVPVAGGKTLLYYGATINGSFGIAVAGTTADVVTGEGTPTTKPATKPAKKPVKKKQPKKKKPKK